MNFPRERDVDLTWYTCPSFTNPLLLTGTRRTTLAHCAPGQGLDSGRRSARAEQDMGIGGGLQGLGFLSHCQICGHRLDSTALSSLRPRV